MANDAASSSFSCFIYDVFLSFRGYTRYGFTDCLYRALTKNRIKTFRDNEDLRVGDEIRPTLLEAIETSRMSIVVLCQNYASSSWCLDEIVKIMECSGAGRKRPILPIFYQVEPSDIRYQKNQYEIAMNKHENRYGKDSERVKAWRSALYAVGDLSGQHCSKDMYEGEIIDRIVEEVLKRLPLEPLHIKHTVGLDSRLDEAKSLLDIESHDTRCMLGICGDDETGKTAFAVKLYNNIRQQFEAASFLANVNEKSKESINGLEDLQKILLSEMGEDAKMNIGSTFKGSSEIKRRLGHKRVLLVLDDVDSVHQLDSLAGGGDWFGRGSRIIITTRDEDMLDKHEVDGVEIKKYCMEEGEFEGMQVSESNHKQKKYVEEEDVVGFVNNFNVIIEQLKEEDSHNDVVSIIGMGGLGKTTLAQKIYNNNEIKKLFRCRAWTCVSKDYNKKEVLLSLLGCLISSTHEFKDPKVDVDDVMKKLKECLRMKKFLIVLDDIWDPEAWDNLKETFPNDRKGSKILITSRNEMVANYTSTRPPHYLPFLDEEESWNLFCKKVFLGEECPSNLESLGRSIVESCAGFPLAIVTLAGFVAKKKRSEREWLRIKGYVQWHLPKDETQKVMNVLKLSYDNLPQRLKPCFLYFGIYPEDTEISARELIRLWVAERFVQPLENALELEDVGDEYLDELVDRSLVQVVSRRSDGGVKKCRIHDLLHDLCILESITDKFLEVCTESNFDALRSSHRLSLLSWNVKSCIPSIGCDQSLEVCTEPNSHTLRSSHRLYLLHKVKSYMPSTKYNESHTRSLFFFDGEKFREDTLRNFQSLSVLHFEQRYYFGKTLRQLKGMLNLKYLKLGRNILSYQGIPGCIWSLPNLETLDARCWATLTSDGIWKLEKLRHVYARVISSLPIKKRGANIKTMWNLQTLSELVLNPTCSDMLFNNFGSLPNLKRLGLRFSGNDDGEQLKSLHSLSNLSTLRIRCLRAMDNNDEKKVSLDVLRCRKIWLDDRPTVSLDAITFPSNLTKITLIGIKGLDSKNMSTILGQITNLKILKLVDPKGTLSSLCCGAAGDFPQLLVFHLQEMDSLEEVILTEGAMPRLQHVVIRDCLYLKKVAPRLESLANLQWVYHPEDFYGPFLEYLETTC